MRFRRPAAMCLMLVFGLATCDTPAPTDNTAPSTAYPPYPWPVTTPARAGLDSARIDSAITALSLDPSVGAVLVVRRDSLAVEYYGRNLGPHNDFELRSVTKSIVSLLVGIAIRNGHLPGTGITFLSVFPEYDLPGIDPRKRDITLQHLLTMRGGFDYVDGGRNADVVGASQDWVGTFFGLPLMFDPGSQFAYASPQTHLLSAVIALKSGSSTRAFAERTLFGPLRISVRNWDTDPTGVHNGGTGMQLTPRDMARVGQLVLRRGVLNGERIVDEAWLDSSIVPRNAVSGAWSTLQEVNYGYQWWLNTEPARSLVFAAGYGGQFIIVDPARDMVVVTAADPPDDPSEAHLREEKLLSIITRFLLTAA